MQNSLVSNNICNDTYKINSLYYTNDCNINEENTKENYYNDFFDVTYTVSYIIYNNGDYYIFRAKNFSFPNEKLKKASSPIIKGYFPLLRENDSYKSICKWSYEGKYGWQLQAQMSTIIMPSDIAGIKNFLVKNIKGIGKKTADKLVETYGADTFNKLKESPDNLTGVAKISKARAEEICDQISSYEYLENLAMFLFENGVDSYSDVEVIFKELGINAINKIKSNPYIICDKVSISKFPLADKIAVNLGVTDNDTRLQMAINFYVYTKTYENSHMYVLYNDMLHDFDKFLYKHKIYNIKINTTNFDNAITKLNEKNKITACATNKGYLIYLKSMFTVESEIADASLYLLENNKPFFIDFDIFFEEYTKKTDIILDKLQEQAVINACSNRFSIITGGPGTGKTQTINAIISCLFACDSNTEIALVAPTGRAAKRISELTGMKAKTIHRYLNITDTPVDELKITDDYVICDEASMIDAPLFHKLILAIANSTASLILIGDKNQLPPVSPGLPFKELLECGKIPSVTLTNLHRQALESQININANKILNGVDGVNDKLLVENNKQDFFIYNVSDIQAIKTLITKVFDRLLELGTSKDEIMVLSPMKKSELGSDALNNLLQNHLNPKKEGKNEVKINDFILREGDKVMQTKNNYHLDGIVISDNDNFNGVIQSGVFNGDIGKISEIDIFNKTITVVYDDYMYDDNVPVKVSKKVLYEYEVAKELALAYAATVHKAQGCEFQCVIMPGADILVNMSRSILYTGVTRASKRFLYIGSEKRLYEGIKNNITLKRNTRLGDLTVEYSKEQKNSPSQ